MNQIYEQLFLAFSEKAQIKQDAVQIAHTLKAAYPNCNLPVPKTIKRVLIGETAHPRDTLLGFLSAFVLEKKEEDVLEADKKNKLGEFYKTYLERTGTRTIASTPTRPIKSVANSSTLPPKRQKEQVKTRLIWALWVAVLLLVGYIFLSKKTAKQEVSLQSISMIKLN